MSSPLVKNELNCFLLLHCFFVHTITYESEDTLWNENKLSLLKSVFFFVVGAVNLAAHKSPWCPTASARQGREESATVNPAVMWGAKCRRLDYTSRTHFGVGWKVCSNASRRQAGKIEEIELLWRTPGPVSNGMSRFGVEDHQQLSFRANQRKWFPMGL